MDVLSTLERKDKWFLGGGRGAIYAPPFPKHLLSPGFWDECFFADVKIPRLFTILVLHEGRPLALRSELVSWRPDRMLIRHAGEGFEALERRSMLECQAWVSDLNILDAPGDLDLFLWSLPERSGGEYGAPWQSCGDCRLLENSLSYEWLTAWPAELEPDRSAVEEERVVAGDAMLPPLAVYIAAGSNLRRASHTVNLAQHHDLSPLWELSVLPEKFRRGSLPGEFKADVGVEPDGLLHLVQHYKWSGGPARFAAAACLSREGAQKNLETAISAPADHSEREWRAYFACVPQFRSSDPFLTNAYWYRWYGLRLNTVDIAGLPIRGTEHPFSPFVTEGIGFFRNFVTYSAQAHLREASWMNDPSLAIGILDNLVNVQRPDGSFPGHNYSCRPSRDFYHADFATGLAQLLALHPQLPGLDGWRDCLRRYLTYFEEHRRSPQGELYFVFDQNETGQEYMSRYQEASEDAEAWGSFRISGVDATVYMHALMSFLGEAKADLVRDALRWHAWNADAAFFCDVLANGRQSSARPATGLYAIGIAGLEEEGRAAASRWLLNPSEFWLDAGFPAAAMSDPTFSSAPEWRGKRMSCPWNGRSWPMANSHLVDALAALARRTRDRELLEAAGEALLKSVRLMFHGSDPNRPNSYEHYNPVHGTPALYRGYDDYMHSWIADLILRHAAGEIPGEDRRDPLPLAGVEWVECDLPKG